MDIVEDDNSNENVNAENNNGSSQDSNDTSNKKNKGNSSVKDQERIKSIKSIQKKALDDLRNKQNETIDKDGDKTKRDRLQFLLERTDIFSHFVKDSKNFKPSSKDQGDKSSPSKRRQNRKDSEENDDIEDANDTESDFITRWTCTPPFVKTGEMKDYQIAGLNWLIKLYDYGINGILADEMGLGKTLQTLSFLCYLKEVREVEGPHLVIVPKSTLTNWMNEFSRWVPSLKVVSFHGTKEERTEQIETKMAPGTFNCLVTTYEVAYREKSALKKFNWRYLIIDEAHRIKNEKSVLSQVVRMFNSQYRLLITGTPLQNNLHELWALLNFLLPEVFSSSEDFDTWFDLKGNTDQQEVINRLHKVLRPFLLRRIKSDVAKGLPPKTETTLYIGMSEMQKEWYTKILMKDIDAINTAMGQNTSGTKTRLSNILMQLRKVCNHPYLFPGSEPGPPFEDGPHLIQNSGKMVLLDKLLKRLKERGSRVLIFSQMTRLLDILEDYMGYVGFNYCRIDGQTSSFDRQSQIDEFNEENSAKFCFLLSTRAGGLGINLATADAVIIFDSDWNPQVDLQAQDRAHRIGQKKPVNVYRFVTEGTVEEKIVERATLKLQLDALVIQQGRLMSQNQNLSKDELLTMIKFGADQIFSSKESTITDEDIDIILGKGAKKTEELNDKLTQTSGNLLELVLNDENAFDMWTYQGESYKDIKKTTHRFIEPPKRERRPATYNESAYYRHVLNTGGGAPKRPPQLRPPKQPNVHPHHFFPPKLQVLLDKETEAWKRKVEEFESREGDVLSIEEIEGDFGGLTENEEKEKEDLIAQGFGEWKKNEFYAFLRGCEKYGRNSFDEISAEVETKTPAEVKKYSAIFWKKCKQIPGIESKVDQIEKGERKIKRREEMIESLRRKISLTKDPWESLKIQYGQNKGKAYTQEEDIFLLCATHKVGYGNWDSLKEEIKKSWQFRFDWFLKSRTTFQIQQRVDTLIRLIEKELAEKEGKSMKKKSPVKSENENSSDKKRSRSSNDSEPSSNKRRK